jgi:hypothetical protein
MTSQTGAGGDADSPAKFHEKDNGLIFYDITPFAYHGWKEYHDGVQKASSRTWRVEP